MSEPRCPASRMNRSKAAALSTALGAAALVVATLVTVFGTSQATPLAIAALAAFICHIWRALRFAGFHPRRFARQTMRMHHGHTPASETIGTN